jgi:hypothetical protein
VLAETTEQPALGADRETSADVGGDLKWSVTPSLALDATVNTDFAQVEVDEQQVNLDRFNLFYPEKRPFFLENAGLFALGTPGEVDLFFSRRIGIGPSGEIVPIAAGARVSGKVAGFYVGVLDMQTRSHGDDVPSNNFAVTRASRELPNRSRVGAIFVNRQGTFRGRIGEPFNAWIDFIRNDVSLPGGRFVTNLLKARLSYSFSTRLYVQALVQYNDVIDNWSTNLRLGWLQTANTGLFVVYNENRATEQDPLGLGVRDRSFTVKFSRQFDLLD